MNLYICSHTTVGLQERRATNHMVRLVVYHVYPGMMALPWVLVLMCAVWI